MTGSKTTNDVLSRLKGLNEHELRRLLVQHLTERKLGLRWEADLIERDEALNADQVLPRLVPEWSCRPQEMAGDAPHRNLIIEGDNFDALRLLRATHAGKIRVIYIDPPYNTGNKDWVYNDRYVGANDRWRHSMWLEFLYRRLTIARDLLTSDGVILVSINDENRSKLELLMDEVFPGRRVGSFVWRSRTGGNDTKGAFLSINHEHVLVYGNSGFRFGGRERNQSLYENPDNDPRGPWTSDNLVKAHNAKDRPDAYYSLQNPANGVWYPCDPDSVWRFATLKRPTKKKLQADPIEKIIEEHRVLWPKDDERVVYNSLGELDAAIRKGSAPKHLRIYKELDKLSKLAETNKKIAKLLTFIEPLENWVGREIGYGKPRYKRFLSTLQREQAPLSTWISPAADVDNEMDDDHFDEFENLVSGHTSEGTSLVRSVLGNKDFQYPKPFSLIKGLLEQAMQPEDIALDFFAGSSTTAHAVLALNEEDGGSRRFILCSSTEANDKEPDKNLCRDVCAERVRRVIAGYGDKAGYGVEQGGEFAYLQLDHIPLPDLPFELDTAHAFQWLSMQRFGVAQPVVQGAILHVGRVADCDILICNKVDQTTVDELAARHAANGAYRFAVYCARPDTLREALAARGIEANTYSLLDTLLAGNAA